MFAFSRSHVLHIVVDFRLYVGGMGPIFIYLSSFNSGKIRILTKFGCFDIHGEIMIVVKWNGTNFIQQFFF